MSEGTLTVEQSLQQALACHQTDRLQEAEALYRAVLQTHPNHPEANHNMGVLAVQKKQPAASLPYFVAALNADPARGQYWLSYIDALLQAGQMEDARQVLALARQNGLQGNEVEALGVRLKGSTQVAAPSNAESQLATKELPFASSASSQNSKNKSGKSARKSVRHQGRNPSPQEIDKLVALFNAGRLTEAAALAQAMTVCFPQHGFGWKVLGAAFKQMGRSTDALPPLQRAVVLSPDDVHAHSNLGITLKALDRLPEAEASLRRALRIKPDYVEAHYNLGNTLKDMGRLDEAEDSYRRALQIKPDFAEAHNNLGLILQDIGHIDEAEASYRRALRIKPDYTEAHSNLGNTLKALGRLGEAEASYRQALQIKPDCVDAHNNLGLILKDLGRLDEAEASYRQALQIKPEFAETHNNLGLTLMSLGRLDEAEVSYRRALEIKPDYADVFSNLGLVLKELGRLDEAEASYRRALQIKPEFAEVHNNLGATLLELGRMGEAEASFRHALQIKPDFSEAHYNLGNTLKDMGRLDEAAAAYRRALEIKPDYAHGYNNLGITLLRSGQLDDAVASFRRALEIKPDYAMAHSNLGNVLQLLGQHDAAVASYRRALEIKPDYADAYSNLLLTLNYTASHAPSYYLEQARLCGRIVAEKVGTRFSTWECAARPERLRVGLVSGDLRKHSVGYFLEGLLIHIDPARIELIAYPTHHEEDELTTRIRPYFLAWKSLVGKSDEVAARLIHADGVHILIDLSGHTSHNRLPVFAWKPAPVQVTWLGLPSTTGVAEMDYVLGDPHAIPAEFENHFSEAVWRMPESCLCLTVPTSQVNVAPLPALSTGYVTFGSFNNLAKMTDAVVAVWVRILNSVPNSRLLLKTKQLNDLVVCEKTFQRFVFCGIAPDRLQLSGTLASADDHLATYNKIDIALDTFPYPGVTTSVEALWMGVPVLSLRGDRFLSRTAGSIAHNAGLPDWVAADEGDYVAKAVTFTSNLERLAVLRNGLRQQVLASPLFDAPRFAKNFEDALWGMWQKWRDRQQEDTITTDPDKRFTPQGAL